MELVLAACAFTGLTTLIVAIDEYINWMDDYNEFGADDREYQRNKQLNNPYERNFSE